MDAYFRITPLFFNLFNAILATSQVVSLESEEYFPFGWKKHVDLQNDVAYYEPNTNHPYANHSSFYNRLEILRWCINEYCTRHIMLWERVTGYRWEYDIQFARLNSCFLELQMAGVFQFIYNRKVDVVILLGCQNCRKHLLTLTEHTENMTCPQCRNNLTQDVIIKCYTHILEDNVSHL